MVKKRKAKGHPTEGDNDDYEILEESSGPQDYTDSNLIQEAKQWLESFESKDSEPTYVYKLRNLRDGSVFTIDGRDLAGSAQGLHLIEHLKTRFSQAKLAFEIAVVRLAREVIGDAGISRITVRFYRMEALKKELKDVGAEHYLQTVSITGRVVSTSQKYPYAMRYEYRCKACAHESVVRVRQLGETIKRPSKCIECDSSDIEILQAVILDAQILKITDVKPEANATNLRLWCLGTDLCSKVMPGRVVEAYGMVNTEDRQDGRGGTIFRLDVNSIENYDAEFEDFELTPADIARFARKNPDSIVNQPGFWEKAWRSFAPEVLGMQEIREALMLLTISLPLIEATGSDYLLLLGLRDATTMNVLVSGSPSLAKSRVLKFVARVAPNSGYVTAARATEASLSVFAGKDEAGTFMITLGLIPQCNLGIVCIDEFDKAKDKVIYDSLHEPMSDKLVTSTKGGVYVKVPADVAVVCACNSVFSNWKVQKNLQENLAFMPPSLLSRFDVIFVIVDRADEQGDYALALKVFENNDKEWLKRYMDDSDAFFGFRTMKKYIHYVNTMVPFPRMPDSLKDSIARHYVAKRKDEELRGLITPRYVSNISRLAKMHARFLQKDEIDEQDKVAAIRILEFSMKAAAIDPVTGKLDGNIIYGETPKSTAEKAKKDKEALMDIFDLLSIKGGQREGFVPTASIVAEMAKPENGGWSKKQTDVMLHKLKGVFLYDSINDDGVQGWKRLS